MPFLDTVRGLVDERLSTDRDSLVKEEAMKQLLQAQEEIAQKEKEVQDMRSKYVEAETEFHAAYLANPEENGESQG